MKPLNRVATNAGRFYETPEGDSFPSVTNILGVISKPALLNWYAKMEREMVVEAAADLFEDVPTAPKMSRIAFIASLVKRIGITKAAVKEVQKAGEIGSQAHALIEWNLRRELGQVVGEQPRVTEKALWAFGSWEKWRQTVELEPIYIEQAVYSKRHQFAGTLDLVARLNLKDEHRDYGRVIAVIDWKTGKAIYPEAKLQNAAYSWAYCEMGHAETPPPGLILRLPKIETDPDFEALIVHDPEIPQLFEAFLAARDLWLWQQKAEAARRKPTPVKSTQEVAALSDRSGELPLGGLKTLPPRVTPSKLSPEEAARMAAARDRLAERRAKLKAQAEEIAKAEEAFGS
jgi:hypothetical protein